MHTYKQQVIEFYSSRTNYDHEEGTQHPREANLLLESVPIQPGHKILDIATGTGLVAIPAAEKVGKQGYVIGVDMTPVMLQQARKKIAAAKLENIELIEANAEEINFDDNSFDVIFCCSAIVLLPNIPANLHKWYRFLKPGGYVAFTFPPETAYLAPVYISICEKVLGVSIPHILSIIGSPEKCQTLLSQAGFRDIEITIENRGRYRTFNNISISQQTLNLCFKAHPLLANISTEEIAQLQVEYKAEIDKLVTEKGVWEDATNFYVRARK
jgi:ubiquinone/menaquinone biosynthesis C-methylase UbiE